MTMRQRAHHSDTKTYQSHLPCYFYTSLAILWLYSGIVPVLFAHTESLHMLAQLSVPYDLQLPLFLGSALLDIGFGVLIGSRYRYHPMLWLAQLIVVAAYSVIVAFGLPENWTHPFAPLIKNVPIMAMLFFLYQHHQGSVA